MRKFSPKKLYKLAKILVIIITFLAVSIAVTNYSRINSNEFTKMVNECNKYYTLLPSDFTLRNSCIKTAYDVLELQQDNFTHAGAIAILLPLIFFGGTWFFKYIFPIKNQA